MYIHYSWRRTAILDLFAPINIVTSYLLACNLCKRKGKVYLASLKFAMRISSLNVNNNRKMFSVLFRFFGFGGQAKKKISTTSTPTSSTLQHANVASGGGSRRRGSDRSLSGSAHELAVCGVRDVASAPRVPHSHSQSNLTDIPYRYAEFRRSKSRFPRISVVSDPVRRDMAILALLACYSLTWHWVGVADDRLIRTRRIFRGDLPRLVKISSRPSPHSIQ